MPLPNSNDQFIQDAQIKQKLYPLNASYWLTSNDEYITNDIKLRLPDVPYYMSRFWNEWNVKNEPIKSFHEVQLDEIKEEVILNEEYLVPLPTEIEQISFAEVEIAQELDIIDSQSEDISTNDDKIIVNSEIIDTPEILVIDPPTMENVYFNQQDSKNQDFYSWLLHLKETNEIPEKTKTIAPKAAPISKKASTKKDDIAQVIEASNKLSEEVVSETLAELYVNQGFIDKAIEMYGKLSLKYPEKSTTFALLIKNLKK
ncbi:MAG: hypothetical protein WAS56_03520 [Saprospiraceae bacterium]